MPQSMFGQTMRYRRPVHCRMGAKTRVKHPRCLYGRVILGGVSVFGRCHAGMALEVFTECELFGKIEFLRDFLDAFVGLLKRKLGVGGRDRRNPFRRRLTGRLPYDSGKMPGGHIGKGGIPIHGALHVVILMEGKYESVCDTAVVVDGINRGGIAADVIAHNLKHGLEADDMRSAHPPNPTALPFSGFRSSDGIAP